MQGHFPRGLSLNSVRDTHMCGRRAHMRTCVEHANLCLEPTVRGRNISLWGSCVSIGDTSSECRLSSGHKTHPSDLICFQIWTFVFVSTKIALHKCWHVSIVQLQTNDKPSQMCEQVSIASCSRLLFEFFWSARRKCSTSGCLVNDRPQACNNFLNWLSVFSAARFDCGYVKVSNYWS